MTTAPGHERLLTPGFLLLIGTGVFYFVAFGMIVPVLPRFVEGPLAAGNLAVGVTIGAFGVGAVLLRPVAGRIGDRRGRRILILTGALIAAGASAALLVADSVPLLVAVRVVQGAGEAAFWVGVATSAADLTPEARRGEGMSYFSFAVYSGAAFGPALGEAVRKAGGYDAVWLTATGLFCAAAIASFWCPSVRLSTPAATRTRLFPREALVPGLVLLLAISGVAGFTAFVPLYGDEVGHDDVSIVFVTFGLLTLAIRLLGAKLPDRLGPLRAGTIAVVGMAAGLATMAAWGTFVGLMVGTVVLAIGIAFLYPGVMTLALIGVPENMRASVVGAVSMCFDLAMTFGALLLGVAASLTGYRGAFAGGAILSVGALLVLRSGLDRRVYLRHWAVRPEEELHEPEITA